ncbi:MAG: YfhO family protein [Lachnospiraceae bacterium]|nr:YfhO family protein [Lachnospiraceae bacterium]
MSIFKNSLEKKIRMPRGFYVLLAFLLPCILILIALMGMGVAPFGDKTLIIADANGLYINTLAYSGRMQKGLEGLMYSFEKGLGGNMMGHLNGILLTPFSFLFSLSSVANYPIAFTFVSVFNFSLAGLTMYLLLASLYGHKRSNLIFSTSYALIGFNVANVFQACFFTALPILPLMVLGQKKIFEGKSPVLYLLSLTYALLKNLFFGFVLCVASVLFFFTQVWVMGEKLQGKRLSLFVKYALSSICGGLLAAVLWLPSLLSLQGGRLEQTSLSDFSLWEHMPFLQMGAKLFTGAHSTAELINGLPNIFVGILPLALAVLFFLNKEIGNRKKIAAGFLLVFYLICFWIVAPNMLMHGGTNTNWFNYRYSYVFSFLLLMLAAELWQHLDRVPFSDMRRCLVLMLLFTVLVFTQRYEFIKGGYVLLDYFLLVLIFLAFWMHRSWPDKNPRGTFELIALILVCVNLFMNYRICTMNVNQGTWGRTLSDYQDLATQVDPLVTALKSTDDSFFRMEVTRQSSGNLGNDPMLYGYNGVGHGGSNERDFVRTGLNKLGVPWYDMRSYYGGGIPAATDTLLGLKYVIAPEDLTEEKGYLNATKFEETKIFGEQDEYFDIYNNENALQAAMLSTKDIEAVETDFADVFANLNEVWSAISGEDKPVLVEEDNITFIPHSFADPSELTAKEAREITAYYDEKASSEAASESESGSEGSSSSISVPEGLSTEAPEEGSYIEYRFKAARDGAVFAYNRSALSLEKGSSIPVVSFVGRFKAGEEVVGYIPINEIYINRIVMEEYSGRFRAAYADEEALHELSELVKSRPLTIEKKSETHLTGTFTAGEGQKLLFTIPYDKGWTCYVDGVETPLSMALDVFMAADVSPGEHTFEMKYMAPGFKAGLSLSALALLMTILFLSFGWKRIDRRFGDNDGFKG